MSQPSLQEFRPHTITIYLEDGTEIRKENVSYYWQGDVLSLYNENLVILAQVPRDCLRKSGSFLSIQFGGVDE